MAELGVGVPPGGRAVGLDPRLPSDTEEESQGRPAGRPVLPHPECFCLVRSFVPLVNRQGRAFLSLSFQIDFSLTRVRLSSLASRSHSSRVYLLLTYC